MLVIFCALLICFIYTKLVLPYQEKRTDLVQFDDKILELLPVKDMSFPISIIAFIAPVLICIPLLHNDKFYDVEKFWLKYACTLVVKSGTLFMTPFDVPRGYIELRDNVCLQFTKKVYGKDLFFSGHTVLVFLCFIHAPSDYISTVLFFATVCMALFLMINRVHYTIDVCIAPFVGYSCHRYVEYILS